MKIFKNLILFCLGGIAYILIEMLWRGYSHWSMLLLGGLCFWVIGMINEHSEWKTPLLFEMLLGTFLITVLELIFGYVLNIRMGLNVWDYSDMRFNILGQVCLRYSVMWFFLSFFCIVIDDNLRYYLFGEEKQKYTWV